MSSEEELEGGALFPRFSAIKGVSARLMAACAAYMCGEAALGSLPTDFDAVSGLPPSAPALARWEAYARAHMYDPATAKL